ncbi:MAG: cobalamin-dependent protein [Dehalococcoidales bacterium]|nr:MAG: cobalamin-dependent protein [Dehalococcoidales bacterium]
MRVLLISTAHPLEENPLPPLSLAYLAAALESNGFEVQILDFLVTRYRPEKVRQKLEEYRPNLVGVTCVTLNYHLAAEMLEVVKTVDPAIVTVIGGPHASFTPRETLLEAPWIDVVVMGEGDTTFVELVKAVDGGGSLETISGIAFTDHGMFVKTEPRPLIEDIDSLPMPSRHLIPLSRYRALGTPCTVVTSRGCPYGCIFCSAHRMFGRKVRFRDPGMVVDEIERIQRDLGFQMVNIVDDTFTVNHAHASQVCEEILRRNLKVDWSAYARVDNMAEELIALMKRAGCHMVLFGVESADERILKTIRKGITPDDVRKGVRIATDAGMRVYCSFIIGLPGEGPDTIEKTKSFSDEINRSYGVEYGYHMLSPLPGTELYERVDDYGIRVFSKDWADFDANRPIVETENMSREMAQEAIDYYDELLEDAWAEIERGAEEGNQEWIARLKQKESIGFIWGLLQEDIFDDTCPASAVNSAGSAEAEAELARRLADKLVMPDDVVQRQVRRLVQEGLIHLVPEAEGYRWRWSDSPAR